MRQITDQQIQELINVLAEMPAKHSYNAIYMLQNLPDAEKQEQSKQELESIGDIKVN